MVLTIFVGIVVNITLQAERPTRRLTGKGYNGII